jgi:hypothetical protein
MTESIAECCISGGPGYKSPLMAMNASKEELLYTVMISCSKNSANEPDCLATIDGLTIISYSVSLLKL